VAGTLLAAFAAGADPLSSGIDGSRQKEASKPASRAAESVFHDRVQLIFKNGQKLSGIVKNHRYAERAEGFDFRSADKTDEGAGLRLWFANPGQNYLFVKYKDIQSVNIVARVSDLEIRELEEKIYQEARAASERDGEELASRRSQRLAGRDAERASEEKAAHDAKKKEKEKAKKAALTSAENLLNRFPPDQGWGEEKKKAIIAKKASHLYPDAEETAFLKLFEDWMKAKALVESAEKGGEVEESADDATGEDESDANPAPSEDSKKKKTKSKSKKS
jgi:hypothetical protein